MNYYEMPRQKQLEIIEKNTPFNRDEGNYILDHIVG